MTMRKVSNQKLVKDLEKALKDMKDMHKNRETYMANFEKPKKTKEQIGA